MNKVEKDLGQLNESQMKVFMNLKHCEKAARWLISEVMREYEQQQILNEEMWRLIRKEFGKNLTEDEMSRLQMDDDGIITVMSREYSEFLRSNDTAKKRLHAIWGGNI